MGDTDQPDRGPVADPVSLLGQIATAEWVGWFNHRRPLEYCDDLTPVGAEQAHYDHHRDPATAGSST